MYANARAWLRRAWPPLCVANLLCWGVFGAMLVAARYVEDLQGFDRPAGELPDYVVFYAGSRLVLDGRGDKLYDLEAVAAQQSRATGVQIDTESVLPYFNPPFVALLLSPLAIAGLLPFAAALLALNAALLLLCGVVLQRAAGLIRAPDRLLFWSLWLTTLPVFVLMAQAQLTMLVLTGFLGWTILESRGHHRHSGLLLAFVLVKPQMALLPLCLLVWQRRWQTLTPFAGAAAVLVLMSVAVSGPGVLVEYPRFTLGSTGWPVPNMHGWQGLLADVLGDETPPRVLFLALVSATFAATVWSWRAVRARNAAAFPLLAAVTIVAGLLANPHLYMHDMLLASLAIGLAALHSQRTTGGLGAWPAVAIGFWFAQLPLHYVLPLDVSFVTVATLGVFALMLRDLRSRPSEAVHFDSEPLRIAA
jgi:hypothetical protein